MAEKPTLQLAFKKLQGLKDRFDRLEKDIGALRDLLNVHDNWHSTIKKWLGKTVKLSAQGVEYVGTLLWSDRYNLCVEFGEKPRIYPKGAIDWIELN